MERELSLVTIKYVGVIECPCGRNLPVHQQQDVIKCPVCGRGYAVKLEAREAIPPSRKYLREYINQEFPGLLHKDNFHGRCPGCYQTTYIQTDDATGRVVYFCWRCGIYTGTKLKM